MLFYLDRRGPNKKTITQSSMTPMNATVSGDNYSD